MTLDKYLRAEYERLFRTCQIETKRRIFVDTIAMRIEQSRTRYLAAVHDTIIPWWFVGVIHMLESNGSFNKHLHNGDPLDKRTVQVPIGRPIKGEPPFTWEASAYDALHYAELHRVRNWGIAQTLYRLEAYNGWGYRRYGINSPYLWSYTNHYTAGKYVSDGKFSATAISQQAGAAAIIRRLNERGLAITSSAWKPVQFSVAVVSEAFILQTFLNEHTGAALRVDGRAGERTSDAFNAAFGMYLRGDPRSV